MIVSNDIKYVGVNDHEVDLFEGQYDVPLGMAYNSYVILDEKVAVMDSVEVGFADEWLANIKAVVGDRTPDYLIIQHMEPDHSSSIDLFRKAYPDTEVVATAKAFTMMDQFFGPDPDAKRMTVGKGDVLSLGGHTLHFVMAPMVHWPEVMVTYDEKDKVLFSADAFGKFGANDVEDPEGWACEARRYYFGIVGKYGAQAQNLLKAAADLDIQIICPLHGPVLDSDLGYYLDLYDKWSSYTPEGEGITIAFNSVYGHTKAAVEQLAEMLRAKGAPKVSVFDLARDDMAEAVEDAFRYDRLVLAGTTYNAEAFPCMRTFIEELVERNYQNRTIGIIENGSWAPTAKKTMLAMLEKCKNITYLENSVTIKSALNDESAAMLEKMADELVAK